MTSKLPEPNGASCGVWNRCGGGTGVGRRTGWVWWCCCAGGTFTAGRFSPERRMFGFVLRPGGGPGGGSDGARPPTPIGVGSLEAGGTPTSVGRRIAGGGGSGRASGGGVILMSSLGSGVSVIGFGVISSGGRACSRMSGAGSLATVRIVVLEEQVLGRHRLDLFLVEDLRIQLFVVPTHRLGGRTPDWRAAGAAAWRRRHPSRPRLHLRLDPGGRQTGDSGAPRHLGARDRRRDLAELLQLRVSSSISYREGPLHPRREILARVELADRVQERLQVVVQIARVLVAIVDVARERLQHDPLELLGDASGCT